MPDPSVPGGEPVEVEESTFDEHSLRAAIVSVWGEYGAHVLVFDYMLLRIDRLELALIKARNPGIDMDDVRRIRASGPSPVEANNG